MMGQSLAYIFSRYPFATSVSQQLISPSILAAPQPVSAAPDSAVIPIILSTARF
jgi:hypothetical protein